MDGRSKQNHFRTARRADLGPVNSTQTDMIVAATIAVNAMRMNSGANH
jgi:hypothetical protein